MTDLSVHTALVYGLESGIDHADPARLNAMLHRAEKVVALSSFRSAVPDQADVVLPISPYTEASGSYLNCNGAMQFSGASLPPRGNSRPGWKVLRVLGNYLSLPGFDYDDVVQVGEELQNPPAVAMKFAEALVRQPEYDANVQTVGRNTFSLVTERAIYQTDPVVRRSTALANTHDGRIADLCRLHPEDLKALNLSEGCEIRLVGEHHKATLELVADPRVVRGCVFVFLGSSKTAAFGSDRAVTVELIDDYG
jgi:NADH-quinone oxidoreductase subunit G